MESETSQLVISPHIAIPLSEIHFDFVKSSGPGGQNVNKVNSQAQLHWNVVESIAVPEGVKARFQRLEANRINKDGVLRLDCQAYRDREKNRQECLNRLRAKLVTAIEVPQSRKKTRVPQWVKEKRLRNKKEKSQVKRLRRPPAQDR